MNFGVAGVALFAFIAGSAATVLDRKYWAGLSRGGARTDLLTLLYPYLLPSYFFMLRGDLMSTWSYMAAYLAVFLGMSRIIRLRLRFHPVPLTEV